MKDISYLYERAVHPLRNSGQETNQALAHNGEQKKYVRISFMSKNIVQQPVEL